MVGLLSILQIALIVMIGYQMYYLETNPRSFFNRDGLKLKEVKDDYKALGLVFIIIALATSVFGIIVLCLGSNYGSKGQSNGMRIVGCYKMLLFMFALMSGFVFFSFFILGFNVYLLSHSAENYLQEYCSPVQGVN